MRHYNAVHLPFVEIKKIMVWFDELGNVGP